MKSFFGHDFSQKTSLKCGSYFFENSIAETAAKFQKHL